MNEANTFLDAFSKVSLLQCRLSGLVGNVQKRLARPSLRSLGVVRGVLGGQDENGQQRPCKVE